MIVHMTGQSLIIDGGELFVKLKITQHFNMNLIKLKEIIPSKFYLVFSYCLFLYLLSFSRNNWRW